MAAALSSAGSRGFMALWLVTDPSTEELLAAAQYSCPVQVVPDQ
jgi:hypothetical protein